MSSSRHNKGDHARSTLVDVSADDWLVGKVIDERYRVERVIGEGGMGRVYEVSDTTFRRRLVLKTLLPGLADDKAAWPRFLREARAAAALGSPHIVAVQEFGNLEDGRSYYVMELADGVSLDEVLDAAEQPMELDRALRIARGIVRALEAAHAAKVVHRDLKPDNVLLVVQGGQTDFVKIVDFGLALMMNAAVRITGRGELVGSPYYMSPEQCADETVDGRADIYALGVILFEMLTLELPHEGEQMVRVLQDKLLKPAPAPSTKGVDLPEEVDALILKCLARQPADRFATATELGDALDALIGASGPKSLSAPPRFNTPSQPAPATDIPLRPPTNTPFSTPAASDPPPSGPTSTSPSAPPVPPGTSSGKVALLMGVIFIVAGLVAGLLTWLLR